MSNYFERVPTYSQKDLLLDREVVGSIQPRRGTLFNLFYSAVDAWDRKDGITYVGQDE